MSTQAEKIRAQEIAFSACGSRHLIGPVELTQLFDEVDRLRERIRRLEEAGNEIAFRLRESVFTEDEVAIEEWDQAKDAKP
jgi:hypothetical protein